MLIPFQGLTRFAALLNQSDKHSDTIMSTAYVGVIFGLSLLLVLFSAPRSFSPGTPFFPSPQKPSPPNSNSSLESVLTLVVAPSSSAYPQLLHRSGLLLLPSSVHTLAHPRRRWLDHSCTLALSVSGEQQDGPLSFKPISQQAEK